MSLILLTPYLLQGGTAGGHPLIVAGIVLWATNVLIFGSHGHMRLTTMAKCLMALQSAVALVTLALVVSRAVNILG